MGPCLRGPDWRSNNYSEDSELKPLERQTIGLDSRRPASDESLLTATVVVCTRYRPMLLRKCLEGIFALERAPDEVIVVDNTTGDQDTESVAREFGVVYTIEPTQGLSRARNRGLVESHSQVVAYLDDDATPEAHWLGYILEPFKDPRVSAVTGRIVPPKSPSGISAGQPTRTLCNKDPEWLGIATFGGLGLGSNMAFRRQACAGQEIFDERLGRGAPLEIAEENYAFALLLSRGDTAAYVPYAIVFHPFGNHTDIKRIARNSIAFSILLFFEFPHHRLDLLRFLYRRMRRKPLTWPRDSPDPGEVITSGWRVLISASFSAALLFLRARKTREK